MKKMVMRMLIVAASAVWAMVGTPMSALASEGWRFSAANGVSVRCTITDQMLISGTTSFVANGVTRVDPKLSGRYESASGDQSVMRVTTSFSLNDAEISCRGREFAMNIENGQIEGLLGTDALSCETVAGRYAYNVNASSYDALASAS